MVSLNSLFSIIKTVAAAISSDHKNSGVDFSVAKNWATAVVTVRSNSLCVLVTN
jgi:hypothetical protein